MDGVALSMVSLRLDNQCKVFSPVFVWLVRILSLSFQEVIIYKNSCNLLFPTGTLVCRYKLMFMRILVFEFFLLEHYKLRLFDNFNCLLELTNCFIVFEPILYIV